VKGRIWFRKIFSILIVLLKSIFTASDVLENLLLNLSSYFQQKEVCNEGAYRAMVAVGTLVSQAGKEMPVKMAKLVGLHDHISALLNKSNYPQKNVECGQTVVSIISSAAT